VSRRITAPAVRRYVTAYANRCACVIAPSHAVADRLRSQGVTARIEVITTGAIDPGVFEHLDPTGVRTEFGLAPDVPLFVTASRLAPEKSVHLVLEAFARIAARRPGALLIIGGGPEEAHLRTRARELGLGDRAVFTGLLAHGRALECIAAGDVFLYASQTETQGLVVAEAMAAGLPVVAVDAGGVSEAVQDGTSGFLVAPDVEALAARGMALLDDPTLRRAMGRAAREAARPFGLDVMTDRIVEVYESCI